MEELKNYYEVEGCNIVSNAKVYDLADSVCASKFPMSTNLNTITNDITKRVI